MNEYTAIDAALDTLDGLNTSKMLGPNPLAAALCLDARAELAALRTRRTAAEARAVEARGLIEECVPMVDALRQLRSSRGLESPTVAKLMPRLRAFLETAR